LFEKVIIIKRLYIIEIRVLNLKMNKMKHILILALFAITISGCKTSQRNTKPTVTVSIIPQKFFIDQIAGEWLTVNVMIPPGASHAVYEPTPQQMLLLSNSQAYFKIGNISFEKAWMKKISSVNKKMKVYDTSTGIELTHEEHSCDHDGEEHHHGAYNPHIWLSPRLVKIQAVNIYNSLAELFPQHSIEMKSNLESFISKCDSVENRLIKNLEPQKGKSFIVYHPVWTYLAQDLGMHQVAIEHNGKEATAKQLATVVSIAKENDIRMIFIQKEFSSAQAETIAKEIGGNVVVMNPLAYEWFNTMSEFESAFNK